MRIPFLIVCGIWLGTAVAAQGGVFTTAPYAGDSDSGVTTQYTYTQAIDFGGSGETINGVPFVADSAGNRVTYQYDVSGATVTATASTDNVSGSSRNLEFRYIYNA